MSRTPPDGYMPIFRTSPFLESIGPVYSRVSGSGIVIGAFVEPQHANQRGFAHGGFLMTLADVALGYNVVFAGADARSFVTASFSADFAGRAQVGDWLEFHVDIQKRGGRLAYANAYGYVANERAIRASAVFVDAGPRTEQLTPPNAGP